MGRPKRRKFRNMEKAIAIVRSCTLEELLLIQIDCDANRILILDDLVMKEIFCRLERKRQLSKIEEGT